MTTSVLEKSKDPLLFGKHPLSWGGRKRGSKKQSRGKKATTTLPVESTTMGRYFTDIDFEIKGLMHEGSPPIKNKKVGPRKWMIYNYSRA